ncbi:MAG: hypothetical protein ICV76_03930, partial [Nitrospiraceae bacterium]|nr:hypothetical protein [Nitrospiraceae bacterium]
CIAEAALWRENSVGAHYRADYADTHRPGWKQHSLTVNRQVCTGNLQPVCE